jgi:hypothetical protein
MKVAQDHRGIGVALSMHLLESFGRAGSAKLVPAGEGLSL